MEINGFMSGNAKVEAESSFASAAITKWLKRTQMY